ncbi:MAG: hypothetical protein EHM50_02770, partial [Lysobacterales bacterium]
MTAAQWALPVGLRLVTPDGTVMTTRTWSQGGTNCSVEAAGGPYDVVRVKGMLYLTTDCHTVYRMQPDGTLEPFAGAPTKDLGFADGVGAEVKFSYPAGLVSDGEYLYLTESTGQRLRRIDLATGETLRIAGCLSNVAGFDCNSSTGFVDGPGDAALFYNPQNLALDPWGDLYVADNDNHAIRFVRLANDPERRPTITSVQPLALQRGAEATVTVRGRDLGLVRSADFGAGVTAEVFERSAKKIKVRVQVAADAPAGAHAFSVTTPFGAAAAPAGVALNVIEERASRARVRTIAGTGDWSLGVNDIMPAEQAQFAFPGGIAAIDRERLLVADPLEQRIRLITTKDGAARELVEIAAYQAGGQTGLAILQGIEGLENLAGDVLGIFGVGNPAEAPREALLEAVSRGLDEICRAAGSDCEYMALPWAGISGGAGDSEGFRLGARLFLPTDIAVAGDGKFVIADTGNQQIKTVGIDFSGPEPMDAPYIVSAADDLRAYPLAAIATAADTVIAATSANATLAKVTLRDESSVLSGFAGVEDAFRCSRADGDVRHPLGVPMGMATGESGTFIADPYCATIWRLDENGEVEDIRGDLKLPLTPLPKCSDGPLVFATFSAPMDVAVDSSGNIWVADSGCHSIRVIKPLGADDVRAALDRWAGGITGSFDSEAAQQIASLAGSQNLGSYDAARMWVTTVAGAADGEAGFRDGAASEALFNAPVSIAIAEENGNTYVFVSDVGNKRIRLIDMNARVETTTRMPPPGGALGPGGQPGVGDEPLSPIDAVNYLLALPWQGLAAQTAADGAQAVDDALEDVYIARGTGEESGLAWSFSLRVNDADADIDLSSPPGFVAASEQGFEVGAPLTGTWRAGFSADVDGNATVKAGNVELFSWTPTIFGFGLGVRDLRMTAKVDLDPNVP